MRMSELFKPPRLIYWSVFILASSAGFLNYFKINGFSTTNFFVLGITGLIIISLNFKNLSKLIISFKPHLFIFIFLIYGVIITRFFHDGFNDKSSIQNLFVYISFFIFLLFAIFKYVNNRYQVLYFAFLYLMVATLCIEIISLWYFGLRWGDNLTPKTEMFVDARSLSMVILLTAGWFLSIWTVKKEFFSFMASILGIILIYLSISRMALVIAIFLTLMAFFVHRLRSVLRELIIFISILILFVFSAYFFDSPLRERYIGSTGVNTTESHPISKFTHINNINIDTSGRELLWKNIFASYLESPFIGKGIGSAEKVNHENNFSNVNSIQPCNDHLRVLHDFGLIGYLLLISQIVIWLYLLIKAYITDSSLKNRVIYLNAAFAIFSIGALAMSDNPFIFSYIMLPLALIIGSAFNQIQENLAA